MSKTKQTKEETDFKYLTKGLEYIEKSHRTMAETLIEMRDDLKLLDIDIMVIKCPKLKSMATKFKKEILEEKKALMERLRLNRDDMMHVRSVLHKIKRLDKKC